MIRIRTLPLAVIAVAGIFGGIAVAASLNLWKTESTKEPVKFKTGELAGLPNPSDIRGSYTWLDIEKAFGVNAVEAAAVFSSAEVKLAADGKVNALEAAYKGKIPEGREIGTDSVRLFVALVSGLPHESEADTALPDTAIAYLKERGKIDEAGAARYSVAGSAAALSADKPVAAPAPAAAPATTHTVVAPAPVVVAPAPAPAEPPKAAAAAEADHAQSEKTITGKTTIGDLYLWGLTETELEGGLGFKPGARSQSVRDAASAAGASFSEIKPRLQALVDTKKK